MKPSHNQHNSFTIPICGYCRQNGDDATSIGHSKANCPVLASLPPCQHCGASGANNHTAIYCPVKPFIEFELDPKKIASIKSMHQELPAYEFNERLTLRSQNTPRSSQSILQRASNIQMTPSKRNHSLGGSANSSLNSPSFSLTPLTLSPSINNDDRRFSLFMDEHILQNSPTAYAECWRRVNRISSTPSRLPSSSSGTGAPTRARRRLSYGVH